MVDLKTQSSGPAFPVQQPLAMPPPKPAEPNIDSASPMSTRLRPQDHLEAGAAAALGKGQPTAAFVDGINGLEMNTLDHLTLVSLLGDITSLKSYTRELLAQPEAFQSTLQTLQTVLTEAQGQGYVIMPQTLSPEHQAVLQTLLTHSGHEALAATLSENDFLSYDLIMGLYQCLQPLQTLSTSLDPQARQEALFQLRLVEDPLEMLPLLSETQNLHNHSADMLKLYNSLTDKTNNTGGSKLIATFSRAIAQQQAEGRSDTSVSASLSATAPLQALDIVLGNLMLDLNQGQVDGRLLQLLERRTELGPQEQAELLKYGIQTEAGQLYALDPTQPGQRQALSSLVLNHIQDLASTLAQPVSERSAEIQMFFAEMQKNFSSYHLVEILTEKRAQLEIEANKLLEKIAGAEAQLQEVETTLQDLDSLLQRFQKDSLTPQDIRILADLGIRLGEGTFVKNKFYDAAGNLIKRKDIKAYLLAKRDTLRQDLAATRAQLGRVRLESRQVEQDLATAAVELVHQQRRLNTAYANLSPAEQARFKLSFENTQKQTMEILLKALNSLQMSGNQAALNQLLNAMNTTDSQQSQSEAQLIDSVSETTATEQVLTASPDTAPQTPTSERSQAFYRAQIQQAAKWEQELENSYLDNIQSAQQYQKNRRQQQESQLRWDHDRALHQQEIQTWHQADSAD